MDAAKTGALIRALRLEKGLTQKQLADRLHLSDRTVSKWERGAGCPDLSLFGALAGELGVDPGRLLAGELGQSPREGGNMKRIQFYVCPVCGEVVFSTGNAAVSCCGRPLAPLRAAPAEGAHTLRLTEMDGGLLAQLKHPMEKGHFISFLACVRYDRVTLVRLWPEQAAEAHLPAAGRADWYFYCTGHGLFRQKS
ncbi:helix-turn-helix domain-containing protein [Allofournierella sp.]|uniref:helix-turn-helix domain-containing protein n=1 Tax=Allofournierella sp. TaxID=1940256 RepID=UPI003AB1DCD7